MTNNDHTETNDDDIISRTDLKKTALEFQALGEKLITLNKKQLAEVPLADSVRAEIDTAKKIKSGNALKRQVRYIGRLIGKTDHQAIEEQLNKFDQKNAMNEPLHRLSEQWRDQLIEDSHTQTSAFIHTYERCNKQQLNQRVRSAVKEHQTNQDTPDKLSNKQKRALFVFIRETLTDHIELTGQ